MKANIAPDRHLEYESAGHGPVVVMLHAFPLCRTMWEPQVAALRSAFRVIAPDFRGFGGSDPFDETPTLELLAADIVRLLDVLKIQETVAVCGLSMGGYVALAMARQFPARLRGLVLADTRAEADDEAAKAGREKLIAFAETHSSGDVIEQLLPKLLAPETRANRPDVVAFVRSIASAQTSRGIIDALKVLRDRPDATMSLKAVRVPTLVLVGSEDVLTPPALAQTLAAGIAGAKFEKIAGAGHLSNLEQPGDFNNSLVAFLNSLT